MVLFQNVAKCLREEYAFTNRPAIKQCFDCDWMDRRAALEAVHESYDIFLNDIRRNSERPGIAQDDRYSQLTKPPVMAGLIVLDMTTSLLEPIMSAKDEGQDICTTLACYEAAKKSLRRWGRSAERITTKALAMLDNEGDCDLSVCSELSA